MAKSPKVTPLGLAFGRRVQASRLAREISQEVLAEKAGLDRSTISKIETGRENPTLLTMNDIALALDEAFDGFYPCRAGLRKS